MAGAAESRQEEDIVASMGAILDLSRKWVEYIRTSETRANLAKSFIGGAIVFLLTSASVLAYELMRNATPFVFVTRLEFRDTVAIGALAGIAFGFALFMLLSRRKNKELEELKGLIERMAKSSEDRSGTENALSVTEKILELLPKVVRRRTGDALLLGIAAFILGSMIGTPAVGILVGALVWVYFRYESTQSYERQMSKLEEQRRDFEREKKRFIESL